MPWDVIVFYMVAAICVLCAGGVVVANNPVHAAIFLVMSFFNVAAIFVMLGAEFLAVVQVIVYTGAILVLVFFVLMLVDPDDLPEFHAARPVQRFVGSSARRDSPARGWGRDHRSHHYRRLRERDS